MKKQAYIIDNTGLFLSALSMAMMSVGVCGVANALGVFPSGLSASIFVLVCGSVLEFFVLKNKFTEITILKEFGKVQK